MDFTPRGGSSARWARVLLAAVAAAAVGCAQLVPAPVAAPQALALPSSRPSLSERPPPVAADQPTAGERLETPPFFPIGIFNVPLGDLEHVRALGFTLVQNYQAEGTVKRSDSAASVDRLKDYLRAAESAGVGVMLGLPRHAIAEGNDEEVQRRVQELRGFRALKAWYLFDEPEMQNVPASAVARAAAIVRRLDGTRPTVLVLAQPARRVAAAGYFDVGDVIMVDPYPYTRPDADVSSVYRTVAEARLLVRGGKPVWATIQAHGRGPGGRGFGLLEPPWRELRNMTFQALAGGASGIFFFCYECSQFDLRRTPQGMENVRRVVGEIRALSSMLLSPPPMQSNVRFTAAPGLVYRAFQHDGFLWLLVVNTTRTELRLNAELHRGAMAATIGVPAEGRTVASTDGRLVDALGPLDVRLYQIPLP